MSRGTRTLAAIHVIGNAVLLWLGYYWLGVGESRASTLAWSFFVALLLLSATAWLHGGAFAYFRGKASPVEALRNTLRFLPALLAIAAGALVVYYFLAKWADFSETPVFKLASWLTLKLRRPVKPSSIQRVFNIALWLVRWAVVPVLLLPVVSAVASRGWQGFGEFRQRAKDLRFWLATPILLVCAFWLPFRILGWTPRVGGFGMEMASFIVRLAIAYLVSISAWLMMAFLSSGLTWRRPKAG